ncbi:flagellar hook-associated protein FlgK [Alteromonas sp. ASW11-19]|uniref:Flagellar hook-associated protein 1 n=1 Tax=Alteromonas salexigens TaxID=2982530 RepID=A0ABT2VQ21_9ALTE|nr:flagellar hook-associated protein FlgK [Alteromonas salexigens]MCU7554972.1 flagellar hook-associated protein FlgK [Alteromonas salexigens]
MRNIDLFTIASSGVNASNKLLQTTGNNIANVNTEGYVRERTVLENNNVFGVGRGTTERVINVFAQNQLRRDITQVGELETFTNKTLALDNMLANQGNSLSEGLSKFFAAVQTAADDPTNLASREQVLGEGRSMLRRMETLSGFMQDKEEELNLEFTSEVNRANSLIKTIGELNEAVAVAKGNNGGDEPTALLNERDNAINELAGIMAIDVRDSSSLSGGVTVTLRSGESLVLEDGAFNIFELSSDADLSFKELQLATTFSGAKANTTINIAETDLGGSMGGLFRYRDEILGPAQRDVGQLGLAFADAMNQQNQLGMDMDGQLGGNLFNVPAFRGMSYEGTPDTLPLQGRITPGKGSELTDADYKITVDAVSGGVPSSVTVELLNGDGSPKLDASGSPVVYTPVAITSGYTELPGGIEIDFTASSGYAVDNEFLLQPTKTAASDITMATSRPEDLAFASPLRATPDPANLGDAKVSAIKVTNTDVDATLGADASAFNGAGGIHGLAGSPSASVGAPAEIVFTSSSSFQVLDGESPANVITNVTGVTDYTDLLAQAQANGSGPAWPAAFSALNDYPGYDISLDGAPQAGDSFSLTYNTDGFGDNANALAMASQQSSNQVQLSSNASSQPRTFHDAYSSLVGRIGEEASSADISLQAAETMKVQSENWFDSVSGVSLDEEAAKLVRYQQSYAAAARILSTAQDLFNTILQAAR